jgi:uncharacterized membrane protein YozB (DUF420 family)
MKVSDLPLVNACFNAVTTTFLLIGFYLIKNGRKEAHKKAMTAALVSSILFLIGYLTYHKLKGGLVTKFVEPAWFRPWYLAILISHTILAVVIVPMVILTFVRAWKGSWEKHKKIARWTFPIWLYVSFTGVLVYLLLYRIFPQTPQ